MPLWARARRVHPGRPDRTDQDENDANEVADQLAALVSALGKRLEMAAGQADDPADRRACEQAAREADRIRDLLGSGES
jgi:hypothetical protein